MNRRPSTTSKISGVTESPNAAWSFCASASLRTMPNTWTPHWTSTYVLLQPMPVEVPVTKAALVSADSVILFI